MSHRSSSRRDVHHVAHRPAFVLLIVMALLALFAVVGLSFVFYAESAALSGSVSRRSQNTDMSDVNPERLFSFALGQLIFDTPDTNSQLYGLSLGMNMYGMQGGTVAFNGLGVPKDAPATDITNLFSKYGQTINGVPIYRNPSYTYPDMSNVYLASIDANGQINQRSFVRGGTPLRANFGSSYTPLNAGGEGDVRNVDGAKTGNVNDAFWIDLGSPVMTAKDGTRYKALYAFTIVDLDGRINLNVAGNFNVDYTNTSSITSRQGLGPWEINLAQVFTSASNKSEINKLFRNTSPPGRIGTSTTATPDGTASFSTTQAYSRIDYSGTSPKNVMTPAAAAAAGYSNLNYTHAPFFASSTTAFADAPAGSSPAAYDYFLARRRGTGIVDDLTFAISNAEQLFRFNENGSFKLTSDFRRIFATGLDPTTSSNLPNYTFITPHSMALDTAHLAPFHDGTATYKWTYGDAYPKTSAFDSTSSQVKATVPSKTSPTGEYTAGMQSVIAGALRRKNVNRSLATTADTVALARDLFDRLVAVTGAIHPTNPNFASKTSTDSDYRATRWLAQYAINMADFLDPDSNPTLFLWNDRGNIANQVEGDYVVGVEINNLVINEVYASVDNDVVNDPTLAASANTPTPDASKVRINCWAELYNPTGTPVALTGAANTSPAYRLFLAKDKAGVDDYNGNPPNATGKPNNILADTNSNGGAVIEWPAGSTVTGGDRQPNGACFYLVGANSSTLLDTTNNSQMWKNKPYFLKWTGNSSTPITWQLTSANMSSTLATLPPVVIDQMTMMVDSAKLLADWRTLKNNYSHVTLVLQRLVNPAQAEQSNPAQANYNPYITVDYFTDIPINDNVRRIHDQSNPDMGMLTTFASMGRIQPLQATSPQPQDPTLAGVTPDPMQPDIKHTFSRQNSKVDGTVTATGDTLKQYFDPFIHLDRNLISTEELVHAAVVPPQQITQRFPNPAIPTALNPATVGPATVSAAYAFGQPDSLLYRFLETVTVGSRAANSQLATAGVPNGVGVGRNPILVPGKISINTLDTTSSNPLMALFDPIVDSSGSNPGVASYFTADQIRGSTNSFWTDLKGSRGTGGIAGFSDFNYTGGATPQVFMRQTLIGSAAPNLFSRIFSGSPGQNEYDKAEAMRKVMNNITFTSNVFAVWVTVGFFEVDEPASPGTPPTIKNEVNKAENRNVRHRMFAIVDRSQMVIPDSSPSVSFTGSVNPGDTTVSLTALTMVATSANPGPTVPAKVEMPSSSLTIVPGMAFTVDAGTANEETVVITNLTGTTATTSPFRYAHSAGTMWLSAIRGAQAPINNMVSGQTQSYLLGYPGPQPNFSMRDYSYVVPFWTVID